MTHETGRFPAPKTRAQKAEEALAWARSDIAALSAQVETLTAQVVAATNDAARAELRARGLTEALAHWDTAFTAWQEGRAGDAKTTDERIAQMRNLLATPPDSDARLREVMLRVAEWVHEVVMFAPEPVIKSELPEIVDEVLGVKP